MKNRNLAAFILASSLTLSAASCVEAQDVKSLFQNFGSNIATWSQLDDRMATLDETIAASVKSGQLSQAQADVFVEQLNSLKAGESQAKSGGKLMGFAQAYRYSTQLNALEAQVQEALDKHIASLPDIDQLETKLKTDISAGVAAGKLSAKEADVLLADLKHVENIQEAFKAETGGNLTTRQIEILSAQLNKVKTNFDQQLQMANSGIAELNKRRTLLDDRLTAAERNGRLTGAQAAELRADLQKIQAKQSQWQADQSGTISGAQLLQLAQELDALSFKFDSRSGVADRSTSDIDRRQGDLQNKIEQLVITGKLLNPDADSIRALLTQNKQLEAGYKVSGNTISEDEAQILTADLERLERRLERLVARTASGGNAGGNYSTGYGGNYGGPRWGQQGGRNWQRDTRRMGNGQPSDNKPETSMPPVANTPASGSMPLPVIMQKAFSDLPGYWGQTYVEELANRGVIGGFPDGRFKPSDLITRAQFAAIVARANNLPTPAGAASNFTDVPAKHWAANAIAAASNAGLITGFPDGSFKPEDSLTRAQALVILAKSLKNVSSDTSSLQNYSDAAAVPGWAAASLAQAAAGRIIVNFPDASQIRPNALATRGEVASLLYQTLARMGAPLPPSQVGVLQNVIMQTTTQ